MGCHPTVKNRLEEDCKRPKALVMQIHKQDKGWQEAIVFIPVCGNTALPTVAQISVGRTGSLACLLGTLAQYSALKPCFLLVTIYVYFLQGGIWHMSPPQSF